MNQLVLPSAESFAVEHAWRLNKRHCDVLQGLDKAETAARLDDAHVKIWRRACITSLSALEKGDPQPGTDNARDADLGPSKFIKTECLQDTAMLPDVLARRSPDRARKQVVYRCASNSLRRVRSISG